MFLLNKRSVAEHKHCGDEVFPQPESVYTPFVNHSLTFGKMMGENGHAISVEWLTNDDTEKPVNRPLRILAPMTLDSFDRSPLAFWVRGDYTSQLKATLWVAHHRGGHACVLCRAVFADCAGIDCGVCGRIRF